ncbi:MAG: DUF2004 domain-containing protein [Planctomycetota bacterium]
MIIEPFGEVDLEELEPEYEAELTVRETLVEMDLNFEEESIDATALEFVPPLIAKLESLADRAFAAIAEDYDAGGEHGARGYLEHHLSEFDTETTLEIFGRETVDKDLFLSRLRLLRVGIYPESTDDYAAVLDIQLPKEHTNYLLAVTFDAAGEFLEVSMDS